MSSQIKRYSLQRMMHKKAKHQLKSNFQTIKKTIIKKLEIIDTQMR